MEKIISILYILLILLCNCKMVDLEEPLALLKDYFKCIQENKYDDLNSFYASTFFNKVSEIDWINNLIQVQIKIGKLKEFKLRSWSVYSISETNDKNHIISFNFNCLYTRGSTNEEVSVLVKKEELYIKIIGHYIKSKNY